MKKFWIMKGLKFLALITLGVSLLGWATMSLWNWLMPTLFGFPLLSFWQALGLLVLSKILFGGFKGSGNHWHAKREHWKMKMSKHFEEMSPEQKERFRSHWERRCKGGWKPWPDESPAQQDA